MNLRALWDELTSKRCFKNSRVSNTHSMRFFCKKCTTFFLCYFFAKGKVDPVLLFSCYVDVIISKHTNKILTKIIIIFLSLSLPPSLSLSLSLYLSKTYISVSTLLLYISTQNRCCADC